MQSSWGQSPVSSSVRPASLERGPVNSFLESEQQIQAGHDFVVQRGKQREAQGKEELIQSWSMFVNLAYFTPPWSPPSYPHLLSKSLPYPTNPLPKTEEENPIGSEAAVVSKKGKKFFGSDPRYGPGETSYYSSYPTATSAITSPHPVP